MGNFAAFIQNLEVLEKYFMLKYVLNKHNKVFRSFPFILRQHNFVQNNWQLTKCLGPSKPRKIKILKNHFKKYKVLLCDQCRNQLKRKLNILRHFTVEYGKEKCWCAFLGLSTCIVIQVNMLTCRTLVTPRLVDGGILRGAPTTVVSRQTLWPYRNKKSL